MSSFETAGSGWAMSVAGRIEQGESGHVQAKISGSLAPGREETLSLNLRAERQPVEVLGLVTRETDREIELDLPIMTRLALYGCVRKHSIDHRDARRRETQRLTPGESGSHRHDQ